MITPRHLLAVLLLLWAGAVHAQILPQSERALQSAAARRLLPGAVRLRPPGDVPPVAGGAPIRVRVWATRDYRVQTLHWQERIRVLVSKVSRMTSAWPGVEFEIVEQRPWDVDSANRPLDAVLRDLMVLDAGEDVDLVIGLASALQIVPESLESLGYASSPGRHLVMRSLYSVGEYTQARQVFDQLDPAERDQLLSARRAHKEVVIFLHEWAHTLGALHAWRPSLLMNPTYDQGQSGFDDGNARLIEASLRARQRGPAAQRAALHSALSQARDPAWDAREREQMLALLAQASPPPAPPDGALQRCLSARGQPAGAARSALIAAACAEAAARSARSPWPALLMAEVHLDAGGAPHALAALDAAEAALAAQPDAEAFAALARLRKKGRSPSLALAAARRAGDEIAAEIEAWHGTIRRRFAIPQDAAGRGLPPRRERDYILAIETAEAAINDGRLRLAARLVEQIGEDFPGLPAAPLLRCELRLREGKLAAADAACAAALALQEDAASAHLLAALVAARLNRCAGVAAHGDRALALDPGLAPLILQARARCR